jgi:hypothetical protein
MPIDNTSSKHPSTPAVQDIARTGRRGFLAQMTGLAAAVALEAPSHIGAAETPPSPAAMPTMRLGDHEISRLVVGSNPLLGYSYMGSHADRHMKEYFTTERTVTFLQDCERAGITAHQFSDPDRALPYVRPLREQGSKLRFICLHAQREKVQEAVAQAQPIAMVHHGGVTDRLFAEGKAELVHDYVKATHDAGVLAGISAHNPDCIQRAADGDWEVDFFMTCFYFLTREIAKVQVELPTLEIAYPFFKDDPRVMTEVIRQVKQPCLGFKILGAGRLCTSQQSVRAAFAFAFQNIKPSDGVIVGMFPWAFDEVNANAQFTRELAANA